MLIGNRSPPLHPLIALLALMGIWLFTHRYMGIQHDGIFYAAQAIAQTDPAAFRHDLFFAFGSQDDYNLFSRPYAWLAGSLGLGRAALILLIAAHLAWATAATCIARRWLSGAGLWIGLTLIFGLGRDYGSDSIFHYAEGFLTARVWSEALVLAGIAATVHERHLAALLTMLAATACHPIIALPGLMFLFAFHTRPQLGMLAVLTLLAAAAAYLLPAIDGNWLAVVARRAPFLLLDRWRWGELGEAFAWIGILLAAARLSVPLLRRAYLALALTGLGGSYLALLGTLSHAAMLLQAQPWRCLWLTKVAGVLALTGMYIQHWQRSAADRWLLAGLAASAITANTLGGPTALALATIALVAWRDDKPPPLPLWVPLAGTVTLTVILLESLLAILQQLLAITERIHAWAAQGIGMPLGDLAAFFNGPLSLILPLAMAFLLWLASSRPRLALALAAALLLPSATGWYRAGDALQETLFQRHPERPFGELIPRNATVQWDNNFLYTWFLLRQGNYASIQQSVGVVFSRETAMETGRRLDRLTVAGMGEGMSRDEVRFDVPRLTMLCADTILDAVIHARRLPETNPPEWRDPVTGTTWRLYLCRDFRSGSVAIDLHPQRQLPQFPTKPPHHPPAIPAPSPA